MSNIAKHFSAIASAQSQGFAIFGSSGLSPSAIAQAAMAGALDQDVAQDLLAEAAVSKTSVKEQKQAAAREKFRSLINREGLGGHVNVLPQKSGVLLVAPNVEPLEVPETQMKRVLDALTWLERVKSAGVEV